MCHDRSLPDVSVLFLLCDSVEWPVLWSYSSLVKLCYLLSMLYDVIDVAVQRFVVDISAFQTCINNVDVDVC